MYSVRRWIATAGLVVLLPMAWQLTLGQISLYDAGKRSAFLLIGVLVIGRLLAFGIRQFADTLDGTWKGTQPELQGSESSPASKAAS